MSDCPLQRETKDGVPDSPQAQYYLGLAYWQKGSLGQARAEWKRLCAWRRTSWMFRVVWWSSDGAEQFRRSPAACRAQRPVASRRPLGAHAPRDRSISARGRWAQHKSNLRLHSNLHPPILQSDGRLGSNLRRWARVVRRGKAAEYRVAAGPPQCAGLGATGRSFGGQEAASQGLQRRQPVRANLSG